MTGVYYFDVLPAHPQPEPLESLTSYLTRLAAANQLRSMTQLFNLCYPNERPRLNISNRDFRPLSFGTLPTVAQCAEPKLLATTFHHLGQKFGRSAYPWTLAKFLTGVLAFHLRYCPLCLAERNYYRLTWRFLVVEGCVEHGCRLLDRCGHCGQPVPFLSYIPQLGVCPNCHQDLRACTATYLDQAQLENVQACIGEFEYLLLPQSYETETERLILVRLIGQRLARWRKVRGLTIVEVARQLGCHQQLFSYLEHGNQQRGLSFQSYFGYANLLHLSLRDLFETPAPTPPPVYNNSDDEALQKIQQAIMILKQQEQRVTQVKISQMTGIRVSIFSKSPKAKTFWAEYKAKARQQQEAELIEGVHQAAVTLKQQGQSPTKTTICQLVGQRLTSLRLQYPKVWAVVVSYCESEALASSHPLNRQNSDHQPQAYRREAELIHKVEQAIEQLQQAGKPVSQYAIAGLVGISKASLMYYPGVRAILQANKAKRPAQTETVLLERVREAVTQLEATDAQVSRAAVARMIGLSTNTFCRHPLIKAFLTEQLARYQERRLRHRLQLEEELVSKVQQAIELLISSGKPVTQKAIGEILEIPVKHLCHSAGVEALLLKASWRVK